MTVVAVDDQGPYTDTGIGTIVIGRPSISVETRPPVVVDTGTATAKTPVPPARPATQHR